MNSSVRKWEGIEDEKERGGNIYPTNFKTQHKAGSFWVFGWVFLTQGWVIIFSWWGQPGKIQWHRPYSQDIWWGIWVSKKLFTPIVPSTCSDTIVVDHVFINMKFLTATVLGCSKNLWWHRFWLGCNPVPLTHGFMKIALTHNTV